jgi:predicted transcriptional regulator of viral defense system
MKFSQLLQIVENEPVFETGLLLTGDIDPKNLRKQLSRWTASGKVIQLRRGLYCLAEPYQKAHPHPFLIANRLKQGSYVSLQSALSFHDLIPEEVFLTTNVTTGRPETISTALGQYDFRHIQIDWFHGYQQINLGGEQKAFIARPEKAILDLVYLQPGGDSEAFLRSLRLQALDKLDPSLLADMAQSSMKPKLIRAAEILRKLVQEESEGDEL